jgi:hypothetical protein
MPPRRAGAMALLRRATAGRTERNRTGEEGSTGERTGVGTETGRIATTGNWKGAATEVSGSRDRGEVDCGEVYFQGAEMERRVTQAATILAVSRFELVLPTGRSREAKLAYSCRRVAWVDVAKKDLRVSRKRVLRVIRERCGALVASASTTEERVGPP